MADKCKECGCACKLCNQDERKQNDMHLHTEIEKLRQRLVERDDHIVTMETQFLNEAEKFPNGELASLKEEISVWQDKYSRLCESHKRVQKVNQNLEDKLLRIVDKCETEKGAFTKDIATLSHRLADANYTIHRLTQDNEKYRNDVNLAIQLLQCKPSNFVGQKYDSLPPEVQAKVRPYVSQKGRSNDVAATEVKSITVPISTFPPTAMVYNVTKPSIDKQDDYSDDESKPPVDVVSAAIMAKVLEDREKDRIFARHCNTCTCHRSVLKVDSETQTIRIDNGYSCNNCPKRQEAEGADEETRNKLFETKDYFNKVDRIETKHYKTNSKESISQCAFSCNRENSLNHSKGRSPSDFSGKRMSFLCINEIADAKSSQNTENSKLANRVNSGAKNYLNLKNTAKSQNFDSNADKIIMDKSKIQLDDNLYDKKHSKDFKNLTSSQWDQDKINIINDRLWKSNWGNSKTQLEVKVDLLEQQKKDSSEAPIDVINDRVWKNNRSRITEKPRLTVIEVSNKKDLTSHNESGQLAVTASSSFSSDSIVISSSDPSSVSSDAVRSNNRQSDYNQSNSSSSYVSKTNKERVTGPRKCLISVTPGYKNILLDNIGPYQTVLYTSDYNRPNTALVHPAKSSPSGRSASISSEENMSVTMQDSIQLQRVAEWVESSVRTDSHALSSDSESLKFGENAQIIPNEIKPPVNSEIAQITLDSSDQHCQEKTQTTLKEVDCSKMKKDAIFVDNTMKLEVEKDLITFEVSSEDENKAKQEHEKIPMKKPAVEATYRVEITKEMEETYLKLAASLDPVSLHLPDSNDTDLTIEKYRMDHKRLQKVAAKSESS